MSRRRPHLLDGPPGITIVCTGRGAHPRVVLGDIPTAEYLSMMMRTVHDHPRVVVLGHPVNDVILAAWVDALAGRQTKVFPCPLCGRRRVLNPASQGRAATGRAVLDISAS